MRLFGILLISSFFWVACSQSLPPKETMTKNISSISVSKTEPYSVSIDAPKLVKTNEVFVIKADLLNSGDSQTTIQHAASIFQFSIRDSIGKQINTFGMKDLGKISTLNTQEPATEEYIYKLDTPGYYEVSAFAKFTIGDGENQKEYKLATNKLIIEVVN